ncbi:MAG: gamma-glutamyltransferase [Marinobacter sp.]|uniref:gamma-glutamyltransferase family protein n=1 Tax=Marinobacter sp. TaxID=50741 RepID=UPI001B423401|nr:gamma-glutamyltransferase [Marinobacter sp.]MBQ0745021.1 gamma-glutamyltransferase [Marinobacter sp.]MBQ0815258.1 gamma-glutamyltransferase [Marinobacter sp.]|tara:strand:- start:2473 stop:4044 length:1572 start_codon:yes stop_codon:yes gene_type:complete
MKAKSTVGVICTPDARATEAGMDILRAGGTAIDAAMAAGAVLSVVYPHMTGLGGDAIWLLSDGQQVDTLLGLGQAGQRLPDAGAIAMRGPASAATTAGALRGWSMAHDWSTHRWGSKLTWPDLLEQAIAFARDGYGISANQVFWQQQRYNLIRDLPDLTDLCCDAQGELLVEGTRVTRPELTTTLEQLARAGMTDFYEGEIAIALAEGFERLGNGLTRGDLVRTQAWHSKPLSIRYRKGTLYNFPPPSQGLYTLSALNALNLVNLESLENGGADYFHYLVEAIKAQLKQRNRQLCDPAGGTLDTRELLSQERAAANFAAIDPKIAVPWQEEGRPADTVWLAASDANGRTACLMQSLFHDFGSGCMVGDTGILWLNRAAGFNQDLAHANGWAPGKRPAHTLNPSAYLADDGQQFYFGSQGGDGQPQTQIVLATQLVDFRQPIDQALLAPRFLQGRSFFGSSEKLKLEQNIAPAVGESLAGRGHDIEWIPELSPFTGLAGAVAVHIDGRREAMHDPRGEGTALGQ